MKRKPIITIEAFEKATGVKFTRHDDGGKLAGFMSLSTACGCNSRCQSRIAMAVGQAADAFGCDYVAKHPQQAFRRYLKEVNPHAFICGACFAAACQKQYGALRTNMESNWRILTTRVFPVEAWPKVNALAFRLESFGDVQNVTQVANYFNFAKANPRTTFAVWTKNPDIYAAAIADGFKKPANLVIILSSPFIGTRANACRYDFVDKVFTVYRDLDQAKASGATINCGGRKCLTCMRCYSRRTTAEVNELLK